MQRFRQPAITLLLALAASPVFTGIHFLFLYLIGYTPWFCFLCAPQAAQGACTVLSTGRSFTIDNGVLLIGLAFLFITSFLFSSLAAWLTHKAISGLLVCLIAACVGIGFGIGTVLNAWSQHGVGPFAQSGTIYLLWGESVIIMIALVASFLGSTLSLRSNSMQEADRQGTVHR